jgi:hypothetical protein
VTEVRTAPVRARPVDYDALEEAGLDALKANAGGFEFVKDREGRVSLMIMICPCGCGNTGGLRIRPAPSPSWEWDGNTEAPTLTPSVHHVGHWHGWLKSGVWESC